MADWDEEYTPSAPAANSYGQSSNDSRSEGRSFGKGRGFNPVTNNDHGNDSWNNSNNDGGWGGDDNRRGRGGGRGGGRGRGGRGGRDGDNDRYNRRRDDNDGGWENSNTDGGFGGNSNNYGENRRGRGGGGRRGNRDDSYGGGRSNGGGWDDDNAGSAKNDSWNDDKGGDDWGSKGGDSWGSKDDNGFGENRRGRGGGRGGGGRGGGGRDGGFGGRNDDGDNQGDGEEKRPPIYMPKERTEQELFDDAGISKGINFKDYKDIPVNVSGDNVPPPISSFADAKLRSILYDNLKRTQFEEPTPIQRYAIPIIMSGRDLMATAQTGSGKTAAFLLPIINNLLERQSVDSDGGGCAKPGAIIFSPVRELATQIYEVARKFAHTSFLKIQQCYGGTSVRYQSGLIQSGCHIIVATPGRLKDFLNRSVLDFSEVKFVVLDEADRMLDQGFNQEIEHFLSHASMRSEHQTLLFSATFGQNVQKLAAKYLRDYVFLSVGIVGGACKDVEQQFLAVDKTEKKPTLKGVLSKEADVRGTLVFVEQKRSADFVASYLSSLNIPTTSIHGDRFQSQREEALRDFRNGQKSVLVATSVAARGLDIKGVNHVINFDLPDSIDDYVHRIGRTGRLGNKGKATSFYDRSQDTRIVNELVHILKEAGQPIPEFLSQDATGGGSFGNDQFGGHDYRSRDDGGSFKTDRNNQPTQVQEEADW